MEGLARHAGVCFGLQWPIEFSSAVVVKGNRWLLVANGAGPRLAARAVEVAAAREKIDVLLSTGFCGALDPALNAGDIFVATRVEAVERALQFEALLPLVGRAFASGPLLSMDRVLCSASEKRCWRERGLSAVEMESASVAAFAAEARLPFYCIRAVSDTAGEDLAVDFNAMRDSAGRFERGRIVAAAFRRPLPRIPALVSFARRCRKAARTLGDFLADCRF